MDSAFAAVTADIKVLQRSLSADHAHSRQEYGLKAEEALNHLCQQCEASLQFLQSLCQQKSFRERLVKNKVFLKNCMDIIPETKMTAGNFSFYSSGLA